MSLPDEAERRALLRRAFGAGMAGVDRVLAENGRLHEQLRLAHAAAAEARSQLPAIRGELARVGSENRGVAESCAALQERLSALSGLLAASCELHASLELEQVLASLEGIIVNLLGSECFAVYVADERRRVFRLAAESDAPALAPRVFEFGQGAAGRAALGEAAWEEIDAPLPGEPRVVVPLRLRERVVGLIAIFGFLPQKARITELDRELFRLLSEQAATALHGAELYAREARRAATFQGLLGLVRV